MSSSSNDKQLAYHPQIAESILPHYVELFPKDRETIRILLRKLERPGTDADSSGWHVTASALVFHMPTSRVLLLYHRSHCQWLQPGGHLQPDELPEDAATRELHEETGARDASLHEWHKNHGVPIDIHEHQIRVGQGAVLPHIHYDFRYVFVSPGTHTDHRGWEAERVRWFALHRVLQGDVAPGLLRTIRKTMQLGLIRD